MNSIAITVYFGGEWQVVDDQWKFIGEKVCKAIVIKENTSYVDLCRMIVDRFKVNTSECDFMLTHANATHSSLKPCDISTTEDIETFIAINKMTHVDGSMPMCASLVKRLDANEVRVAESGFVPATNMQEMAQPATFEHTVGMSDKFLECRMDEPNRMNASLPNHVEDDGTALIGIGKECDAEPLIHNGFIKKGQTFASKDELKNALCLLAISQCFQFKIKKSSISLVLAVCIDNQCGWRVRASKLMNSKLFFVTKYIDKHTCSLQKRRAHHRKASYQVIAERIRSMYRGLNKAPTPKEINTVVLNEFKMQVSYWKCWKAQEATHKIMRGKEEDSYTCLPSYLYMLQLVNPGTIVNLEVDAEKRFKYVFFAFGASIRGYEVMRKVITVDGAHLKGKFGGVFLVATAQDANQQIYPLAFAFVDGENDASWDFFFKNLRKFVDNCDEQVFVSDRNQSIKKAISTNYSQAKHGICLFHLKQNVITRCRVKKILHMITMAAKSYRQTECIRLCNEISQENPVIGAYIQEAGVETWCRSFFPGKRYNIMTSNNAESMNSKFKEAREYPLLAFFDDIRVCLSKWFNERRQLAENSQDHAPNEVEKIIQLKYNQAMRYSCSPLNATTMEFEVSGGERDEVVRLLEKSCTCMEFDMEEIPCVHALAVAIRIGIDADSLVGKYYTTECWRKGYEMTIYPIPHSSDWSVPQQYQDFICNPPRKCKRPGRPRKVRIPSVGEFKRRKCSRCGTPGHNKKTCTN